MQASHRVRRTVDATGVTPLVVIWLCVCAAAGWATWQVDRPFWLGPAAVTVLTFAGAAALWTPRHVATVLTLAAISPTIPPVGVVYAAQAGEVFTGDAALRLALAMVLVAVAAHRLSIRPWRRVALSYGFVLAGVPVAHFGAPAGLYLAYLLAAAGVLAPSAWTRARRERSCAPPAI